MTACKVKHVHSFYSHCWLIYTQQHQAALTATVTTVTFISIFWSPYILDYLFMSPAQIKTPSIFDFD